jgi:predicted SAM-dependent methyltransferase
MDKEPEHKMIEEYLSQNNIRKLHLGCGVNILQGWLNSDYNPKSSTVLHLDASRPFPFDNDVFDYIFSEHMIEHVTYSQGSLMLTECVRVLKKGGKVRISTPDLLFLVNLYKMEKSDLQKEYIQWATENFINEAPYPDDTFVINNFVRDWGHLFIYDEKTLRSSMERAGFRRITKCNLKESEDEALRNLENEDRMPKGFLQLETMTLEGTKSLAR